MLRESGGPELLSGRSGGRVSSPAGATCGIQTGRIDCYKEAPGRRVPTTSHAASVDPLEPQLTAVSRCICLLRLQESLCIEATVGRRVHCRGGFEYCLRISACVKCKHQVDV